MIHKCWKCQAANVVEAKGGEPQYRCWKCGHLNNGSALGDDTVIVGKQPVVQ
jgi:uncharacterized Zn finger protein